MQYAHREKCGPGRRPEWLRQCDTRSLELDGDLQSEIARETARKVIYIALALMHSPAYGEEHASALAADWARIPLPRSASIAEQIFQCGKKLANLLDCSVDATTTLREILSPEILKTVGILKRSDEQPLSAEDLRVTVSYFGAAPGRFVCEEGQSAGDLWINENVYLANVPLGAWQRELGGYQVIKKWLGYRHFQRNHDRPLTLDEQRWLRNIVLRLTAIGTLGPSLDEVYTAASSDTLSFSESTTFQSVAE